MQISGQLATQGIQYNQSLAGTGGSAGAAAGCYTDERYMYDTYTSMSWHILVHLYVEPIQQERNYTTTTTTTTTARYLLGLP